MILTGMLKPQTKKVPIDGIDLYMKKLNWLELVAFQTFAESLEEDEADEADEDEDAEEPAEPKMTAEQRETHETRLLAEHILNEYVRDKAGDIVINPEDIPGLPVDFCIKVVTKFVALTRGEADTKKK